MTHQQKPELIARPDEERDADSATNLETNNETPGNNPSENYSRDQPFSDRFVLKFVVCTPLIGLAIKFFEGGASDTTYIGAVFLLIASSVAVAKRKWSIILSISAAVAAMGILCIILYGIAANIRR